MVSPIAVEKNTHSYRILIAIEFTKQLLILQVNVAECRKMTDYDPDKNLSGYRIPEPPPSVLYHPCLFWGVYYGCVSYALSFISGSGSALAQGL